MSDETTTRRKVLKKAAYTTPAILTLKANLEFASAGSGPTPTRDPVITERPELRNPDEPSPGGTKPPPPQSQAALNRCPPTVHLQARRRRSAQNCHLPARQPRSARSRPPWATWCRAIRHRPKMPRIQHPGGGDPCGVAG
jgi:hypothetical protein